MILWIKRSVYSPVREYSPVIFSCLVKIVKIILLLGLRFIRMAKARWSEPRDPHQPSSLLDRVGEPSSSMWQRHGGAFLDRVAAMAGTVEVRQDGHFDAEKILSKRSVPCRGKEHYQLLRGHCQLLCSRPGWTLPQDNLMIFDVITCRIEYLKKKIDVNLSTQVVS